MKTWPFLTTLFLAGCQLVVPSGNITTNARDVPAFRKVHVASGLTA